MNGVGMQNKTIKKILSEKILDWLSTIKDKEVRALAKRDVIVTGGSIASMIMGDKVNDFDLYFRTKKTTLAVAKYYVQEFSKANGYSYGREDAFINVREETLQNCLGEDEERVVIWVSSTGVAQENGFKERDESMMEQSEIEEVEEQDEDDSKEKYRPVFLSENAVTLSNRVQVVTRFYGEPNEIHRNYDFIHACCYYDHYNNVLETPVEALRSMQSKTLYYRGSLYPICSLFRTRKFLKRGWKIGAGEILKMSFQVSELDLSDLNVLREQLTGVDQLYMFQLYDALKKSNESGTEISSTYVGAIIDRIFGDN